MSATGDWLEPLLRLGAFAVVFAALALFELLSPRLERDELRGALKSRRWRTNLSILILSSAVLRIVFPLGAVGAALFAESRGLGLLRMAGVPPLVAGGVSIVALDFWVWLAHVGSHKIPLVWRFHRVHHADPGFDVTTGIRFHPVEILASMLWKAAMVVLLGAPVLSVLVFEIVLNATAMFTHANIRIPARLDKLLRTLVVTPDMHRVHHSTDARETDTNYGFNLSVWDRLFGTYVARPAGGHTHMGIGLGDVSGKDATRLRLVLALPFLSSRAGRQ